MIDARTQRRPSASSIRRRAVPILLSGLLALLLAAPAIAGTPATTQGSGLSPQTLTPSSTADTMAASILTWLNRDRTAAGLRPLRAWTSLATLANQRAANMAATKTLTHTAAGGDPGAAMTRAGIQWYSFGEIIGATSYPWGTQAASNLYSMWRKSAPHHAIMFSATYNYVGVGIARASDGSTWASVLFSESVDHTRPAAKNGTLSYSGTTLKFTWSGYDPLLQTHTAGLRSFDVAYRVDGGAWHLIRDNTTARYLYLSGRAHGHYYSFRVQAADKRGNLSAWTAEKRIWLP